MSIPARESLSVEFKSDAKRLPDHELVAAAVCLANGEGGDIYLGVEDDGRVTGLHPAHQPPDGVAALIANRTSPSLVVGVETLVVGGKSVARIRVPRAQRLTATTEGLMLRRRLQADGRPECVPFLPHEFASRQSDLGSLDLTALPVAGASLADLDPMERLRLRRTIEASAGDRALLALSDDDFDAALGLVKRYDWARLPSLAGLLLLGRETALRDFVPTHEIAFQVLEGTEVRVNEFSRAPLVRALERLEDLVTARVTERELEVGLLRVAVPNIERAVFREALANAVTHRDYARLGAVHVRWEGSTMSISNPGGFVDGVSLENLIVVDPSPRNPLLADIFKRLGLVERTGRGVDRIFAGLLRYGRPAPSYGGSDRHRVVLRLSTGEAHLGFLRLVLEQERQGGPLPLDSLLVLNHLRDTRRVTGADVAMLIQRDEATARQVLESLVESGLVEVHGIKKDRRYRLSAAVSKRMEGTGAVADVRPAGFNRIQQEQMVLKLAKTKGRIRRADVMALCQITGSQASKLLGRLVDEALIERSGTRKATEYGLPKPTSGDQRPRH